MRIFSFLSRRSFLKKASVLAMPAIVPSRVFGKDAPSNKIAVAVIGLGMKGTGHTKTLARSDEAELVALCDLDKSQNDKLLNTGKGLKGRKFKQYTDYREMFEKEKLDAVVNATPDHWHTGVNLAALRAGLDVYGEKPLTHRLNEGKLVVKTLEETGRIFQIGSQQRSMVRMHKAAELVRNGRIGKVSKVTLFLGSSYTDFAKTKERTKKEKPPSSLNYEMWLGPAPKIPYIPCRHHKNWRWFDDYGGGKIMDWIGHHGDIGLWALGLDRTGPYEIEGTGKIDSEYEVTARFKSGVEFKLTSERQDKRKSGTLWEGSDGWIFVSRKSLEASKKEILYEKIGDKEIHLKKSLNHFRDFFESVKSRKETVAPAVVGHRAASLGHLANIALKMKRKIRWDPEKEVIIGDKEASRLLTKDYRKPWGLS